MKTIIFNKTIKPKKIILLTFLMGIYNLYSFTEKPMKLSSKEAFENVRVTMQAAFVIGPHALFMRNNRIGRYDIKNDKQLGMGRLDKGSWAGIPDNIGAALYHPENKKAYFFKGNMYYQFDLKSKKLEIKGKIGERGWKGLTGGYDAALSHPTNRHAYFFKGSKYYKYSFVKRKMVSSGTIGQDAWKGVPSNVDLALLHTNGRAYFFDGHFYYRYDFKLNKVDKKGRIGIDGWRGLFKTVDAALQHIKGQTHFILGSRIPESGKAKKSFGILEALFYSIPGIENKKLGKDRYVGMTPTVDAGMYREKTKTAYLFKKFFYWEYKNGTTKLHKKSPIGGSNHYFKGVPNNLDACFVHDNGKAYFFRGDKFYRFDFDKNVVDQQGIIGVDAFKFIPKNLEAAHYKNGKAYFYKQGIEYVYETKTKKVTTREAI